MTQAMGQISISFCNSSQTVTECTGFKVADRDFQQVTVSITHGNDLIAYLYRDKEQIVVPEQTFIFKALSEFLNQSNMTDIMRIWNNLNFTVTSQPIASNPSRSKFRCFLCI